METVAAFFKQLGPWWVTGAAVILAVLAALAASVVMRAVLAPVERREPWLVDIHRRVRSRWRALVLVVALWIALGATEPGRLDSWPVLSRLFLIAAIVTTAWFLSAFVSFGLERVKGRFSAPDIADEPEARRRRAQLTVLQRLAAVLITVVAVGAVLFTFPEVRAVGASVLASAGIVSIIAGLAAQSTLGNLIAGLQIAFSNAIREGDVVVVEGEWGKIGEITLSYVVVHVWDERRLILPCTYFVSNPFEVWTRQSDKILGTVLMDLDWRVPVAMVRQRFMEIVEASELWDRRAASVIVAETQGGLVTVRFLVSAANSSDQFDLRVHVREEMLTWLQREHPEALPTSRVRIEGQAV